jgi:hypothetical protein
VPRSIYARSLVRACAAVFAALFLYSAPLPLQAATTADDLSALSGVSTSESEALDKEADKLVEDSLKAKADAAAAFKEAQAKIDPKKVAEALKRGDTSVLSQQSPEEQHARELMAQAEQLAKQAAAKAEDAAAKRANAALEQRCMAPSAASSTPAGDPQASSYLCSAVRAGGAKTGRNNPWELCACMRQYLTGLQKDYDSLQSRVQRFVGQSHIGMGTITAEQVEQTFKRQYSRHVPPERFIAQATNAFEQDARGIQKDLARGRINKLITGRGYTPSDFDTFLLSRRGAYQEVVNAQREVWKLQQIESDWQRGIIDQDNVTRQRRLSEAFAAAAGAVTARHPSEFQDWDDANSFKVELEALSKSSDERDYRYIEDAAAKLRTMVGVLRDVHRRFDHDTTDWKNFAAKDGENPSAEWPLDPTEPLTLDIHPSRGDPVGCCLFSHWSPGQPQLGSDPETLVWAHFPEELLRNYPEITLRGHDTNWQINSPWVTLKFSIDDRHPTLVTGIASGAGDTQRP